MTIIIKCVTADQPSVTTVRRRGHEWWAQRSPDREPDRRDRTVDCRGGRATRSTTPKLSPGFARGGVGWVGRRRCARTRFLRARAGTVVAHTRTHIAAACVCACQWLMGGAGSGDRGRGRHPASCNRRFPTTAAAGVRRRRRRRSLRRSSTALIVAAHRRRARSSAAAAALIPSHADSAGPLDRSAASAGVSSAPRGADRPRVGFPFFFTRALIINSIFYYLCFRISQSLIYY